MLQGRPKLFYQANRAFYGENRLLLRNLFDFGNSFAKSLAS